MVKLTYLSAVFLAVATNLIPTYAAPLDGGVLEASPANSTFTPDPKGGSLDLVGLEDVGAVVNGYSFGTTLNQVILLRPNVCERLTATTAEYTWKKNANQRGKNHLISFNSKFGMSATS
jgi:hypothetical protein